MLSNDQSVVIHRESLTYFDVQNMVRADSLATILVELFYVNGNGQSLQFLAPLGELAHPLGSGRLRLVSGYTMRRKSLISVCFRDNFPGD